MANILIVEDDVGLGMDLKVLIEDEGHRCGFYRHADDVIGNLDSLHQYDFIILDIMMLRGTKLKDDNFEIETGEILYKKIREKYPNKKIIIISAKSPEEMTIDFRKERNVYFLEKALNEEKLRELLEMFR